MVPRVVNLLTLVLLVGTTWWSSAQRPVVRDLTDSLAATKATQITNKPSQLPVDNSVKVPGTSASPSVSSDSIITVGFTGTHLR